MQMTMKVLMLALGVGSLASCTKEPLKNLTAEESRIYITDHDSSVNFSSFKTFSIVDTVSIIEDGQLSGKQLTAWDASILNAVAAEMTARGYTQVGRTENPDLGVNVSRIYNTYNGVMSYPDYWGGYGGYYDPFYWGYPGSSYYFPQRYSIYQITEGAASIDLLDLKTASTTKQIRGVWNGLIRGTGVFNVNNAPSQVKALFDQSPYLKANQ
jgi:hypothetical protein